MTIFISIMVLAVVAIRFKDFNLLDNCLLEEIKRENLELKNSMESFQVGNKMSQNIPTKSVETLDGHFIPLSDMLAEDTGFNGDKEDFSDSFNYTRIGRTFDPHGVAFSFSNDQYEYGTAATSRETSTTNQVMNTIEMAMEALTSSLVHSRPA